MSQLNASKLVALLYCHREFRNPLVISCPRIHTTSDCSHRRYIYLFFDYVQELSAIADGRAGANPNACRKHSQIVSITTMACGNHASVWIKVATSNSSLTWTSRLVSSKFSLLHQPQLRATMSSLLFVEKQLFVQPRPPITCW